MRETAPNKALEPTAYSFGFAYASGGGSPPALGARAELDVLHSQMPGASPLPQQRQPSGLPVGHTAIHPSRLVRASNGARRKVHLKFLSAVAMYRI